MSSKDECVGWAHEKYLKLTLYFELEEIFGSLRITKKMVSKSQ